MLRVILATLGVALIAFGLFGGKSLEQVYAGLNGVIDKFGSDGSQEIVADSASVNSGVNSGAEQMTQSDTVVANNSSGSNGIVSSAVGSSSALQVSDSQQEDVDEPAVAEVVTDAGSEQPEVSDAERRLNIANVQPADEGSSAVNKAAENVVEDSSAVKEVKASARNEELELALAAGSEESQLPKDAGVGEILQTTTGGDKVEALFVLKDLVNMRQGPSIEHPVVLRLEKGQELMEFKRDGKWVHVGAYGTSGKIGWVHERLVGKTPG